MSLDLYTTDDYRNIIKSRVKELKGSRPHLTLRWLAEKIPLQYTYLSKALNHDTAHLSEDHLFRISKYLEFLPDETDYLLLLRARAVTQDDQRREFLDRRLGEIQRQRSVRADYTMSSSDLNKELRYLFNPLCTIVYTALFIEDYKRAPQRLCSHLGISANKLKEVLEALEENGFLELGASAFEIKEVKSRYPHFGKEHPLMRTHQMALKSQMLARFNQTTESDKEGFNATFTMDEEGAKQVKNLFQDFIKKVQEVSFASQANHVYQLNFDFLRWF